MVERRRPVLCYNKPQTEPTSPCWLTIHPFEPSYALVVVDETLTPSSRKLVVSLMWMKPYPVQSKACCEFVVDETLTIQ
jgi:hypothetical protein